MIKANLDSFRWKSSIAMHKHEIKDIIFQDVDNKTNMIIFYERDTSFWTARRWPYKAIPVLS